MKKAGQASSRACPPFLPSSYLTPSVRTTLPPSLPSYPSSFFRLTIHTPSPPSLPPSFPLVQLCGFELITRVFYSWEVSAALVHSPGPWQWLVSFGSALITVRREGRKGGKKGGRGSCDCLCARCEEVRSPSIVSHSLLSHPLSPSLPSFLPPSLH